MQCPTCGTDLPDGSTACTTCGARISPRAAEPQPAEAETLPVDAGPDPLDDDADPWYPAEDEETDGPEDVPARAPRKQTGLVIGLVAVVLVLLGIATAIAVVYVLPAYTVRTAGERPAAGQPAAVDAAEAASDAEHRAVEVAVTSFYGAVNSGGFDALTSMVTSDTTAAVKPGKFKKWKVTTFQVVRSAVNGDEASVYGRESVRSLGSKDKGVKFTLLRVDGEWLIDAWRPVDEGTVTGAMPSGQSSGVLALTAATARDVVSTLLQARQHGDASVVRLVTTARFQKVYADPWLNEVDNSATFTAFSITKVKKVGAAVRVAVRERWGTRVDISTYTVVMRDQTILVDRWVVR